MLTLPSELTNSRFINKLCFLSHKEGYLTVPPQPGSKKLRFVVHIKV